MTVGDHPPAEQPVADSQGAADRAMEHLRSLPYSDLGPAGRALLGVQSNDPLTIAAQERDAARELANRLFNAVIVLYGAARELRFGAAEEEDARLHETVLMRAQADLGVDLLARVEQAIERRTDGIG